MRSDPSVDKLPLGQRTIRPERVMCGGFLLLILLGSVLLALPVSTLSGESIGLANGLFTSTSAVCVTGLVVVDTGRTFSLFGRIVLLVLIQTGGLGFMAFATMVMAALGKRITLRDRLLMRESLNTSTLSGLARLILWYGLMALIIEVAGAALLSFRLVPQLGWAQGLWFSLWHAVSAFCNAGFDLFGGFSSLTAYVNDPLVLLTAAGLIVLGSMGFAVMSEVIEQRLRWRWLSLHAKLALVMTGGLLLVGTAAFLLLEWGNPGTLGPLKAPDKVLNAFFQSVTMRTAGFNSVDLAAMTDGSKLVSVLLMLIGANSASTGGGMKTTTVAVLALAVGSVIRGREETTVMGRRLPRDVIMRALAVVAVTLLVFLTGTLLLAIAEDGRVPFIDLMFETASAMATVGVSSAGTPEMSLMSKIVLVPMMYMGRVGPLTLALALANRQDGRRGRLRYPEESVTIG